MFVYSIRASTVRFFCFVLAALFLLVGAVAFGSETVYASSGTEVNYGNIKDNEDRVAFIEGFGIKVEDTPIDEEGFVMPENFDRVILGYNELQKKQGLDLSKYAKKRVTRYTYKVENWDSDGEVNVNLFVYRNTVIACDVSSADPDGFVIPMTLITELKLKKD